MKGAFTIQEIREQPEALARLMAEELPAIRRAARTLQRRPPSAVVLAARGSSDNAALYGHYLFETLLGIPAGLASPSVVTIYRKTPRLRGMLVVALSQSGRSPDIVEYLREARKAGAQTIAVTNDPRSPLAREAAATLLLHAGTEHSVAATKTYTSQLAVLSLLAGAMADDGIFIDRHHALPDLIHRALRYEDRVAEAAARFRTMRRCIVTSRGYNFATAREAALKLKETSYVAAEPLSSADLLHGPIAVVEERFPVIVIVPPGRARTHLLRVTAQLRARRAQTILVSAERGARTGGGVALPVPVGVEEILSPHVYIVPLQLFAYHLALARGFDPDRPRGLRKVTRVL